MAPASRPAVHSGRVCRCAVTLCLVAGCITCFGQAPAKPSTQAGPAMHCVGENIEQSIASGNLPQAEKELRQLLSVHALCPEAHFRLAYVLLRENHAPESLAEYTTAAHLQTPGAGDLRSVALDYVLLDDYIDADHWIQRALQEDGNDSETWYVLGRIRYSTGRFEDAAAAFERVLTLRPGSVKAEDNLGLVYEGLNQVGRAREAYRNAIAFGDKSGESTERPMIDLAVLLEHQSDFAGAEALLTRAVSLAPDDPNAREQLGHVYLQRNDLAQAQLQLEKAVSLSPSDARMHYLLGQVYRKEGKRERADTEFSRFAALSGAHSGTAATR